MSDMENIVEEAAEAVIESESERTDADETECLRARVAELSDKYIRAMAEIENTRRRAKSDVESALRTRAMNIAESFLPLIDAIEAASAHAPDDAGIKALCGAAAGVLANVGIVKIETVGCALNPQFHNAISTVEDNKESGKITEECQSGYMFGDTVLRPATVIVAK